eukprot:PhF_6_TR37526/c0_g1_i1/m.55504
MAEIDIETDIDMAQLIHIDYGQLRVVMKAILENMRKANNTANDAKQQMNTVNEKLADLMEKQKQLNDDGKDKDKDKEKDDTLGKEVDALKSRVGDLEALVAKLQKANEAANVPPRKSSQEGAGTPIPVDGSTVTSNAITDEQSPVPTQPPSTPPTNGNNNTVPGGMKKGEDNVSAAALKELRDALEDHAQRINELEKQRGGKTTPEGERRPSTSSSNIAPTAEGPKKMTKTVNPQRKKSGSEETTPQPMSLTKQGRTTPPSPSAPNAADLLEPRITSLEDTARGLQDNIASTIDPRVTALEKTCNKLKDELEVVKLLNQGGGNNAATTSPSTANNNDGVNSPTDAAQPSSTVFTAMYNRMRDIEERLEEKISNDNKTLKPLVNGIDKKLRELPLLGPSEVEDVKKLLEVVADCSGLKNVLYDKQDDINNIGGLRDHIADMQRQLGPIMSLSTKQQALEDGMNGFQSRVQGLEGFLKSALGKLSKDDADKAIGEMASLATTLAEIQRRVSNVQRDMEGTNRSVNDLEKAVHALNAAKSSDNSRVPQTASFPTPPSVTRGDFESLRESVANNKNEVATRLQGIEDEQDKLLKVVQGLKLKADIPAPIVSRKSSTATGNVPEEILQLSAEVSTLKKQIASVMEGLADESAKNVKMQRNVSGIQVQVEGANRIGQQNKDAIGEMKSEIHTTHTALNGLDKAIKDVQANLTSLTDDLQARIAQITDHLAELAMKTLSGGGAALQPTKPALPAKDYGPTIDSINRALNSLRDDVADHGGKLIHILHTDKSNKDAVTALKNQLEDLRKLVTLITAGGGGGSGGAAPEAFMTDMTNRIGNIMQEAVKQQEWTQGQIIEIRTTIEHIFLQKADAASLATKAEIEYVENALGRLRHDVEDVINATNGSIIDTLDKSLTALRDLIGTKASASDVGKLKDWMMGHGGGGAGGASNGTVPQGLIGFRCLSCNQNVESMRPRPMGMNFVSFMAHLPNASKHRTIEPRAPQPPPSLPPAALPPTNPFKRITQQ